MGTYTLEYGDEDAHVVANLMDTVLESPISLANHSRELLAGLRDAIRRQIPIPVPVKIGAVVKTEHPTLGGCYLRWAHDNHTHSPWVQVGNHEEPYRTDEIGRITEVLSSGVDL